MKKLRLIACIAALALCMPLLSSCMLLYSRHSTSEELQAQVSEIETAAKKDYEVVENEKHESVILAENAAGKEYVGALENYMTYRNFDLSTLYDLAPEEFWTWMGAEHGYDPENEAHFSQFFDGDMKGWRDDVNDQYGSDAQVLLIELEDERADRDDLAELARELNRNYSVPEADVVRAYEAELECAIEGLSYEHNDSGQRERKYRELDITFVKIRDAWYPVSDDGEFIIWPVAYRYVDVTDD